MTGYIMGNSMNEHINKPVTIRPASTGVPREWTCPAGFRIDKRWFDRSSSIHGKAHTLRVMIHARWLIVRLKEFAEVADTLLERDLLTAALIHDMGRRSDGGCTEHGRWAREGKRHVAELFAGSLDDEAWDRIGRAVEAHSRDDPSNGFPSGGLTALLKDADALDRVRLGKDPNPRYFRHTFTRERVDQAWRLMEIDEEDLEASLFGCRVDAPGAEEEA